MKKPLLLLLIPIALMFAKENEFSLIVQKPFDAALFSITQDYDREISAVGFSKNFSQSSQQGQVYTNAFDYLSSISNKYGSMIHLIKVNNKAELLLSKMAPLNRFTEAVALLKTPDNGYFVGGHTLDGQLILAKLNANAELIYTRLFGTKNYDRMHNLIGLSDGGVLCVASSTTSRAANESLFESGLGNNDIYIIRFDKNGAKLWEHKYGTSYDDEGVDAVEATDGSIMVLAKTSYDKHKDVTLMRLSENGDKIWLHHYKGENLTIPTRIIRLRDNNFLVVINIYDEMQKEHIRLIKFDLYKNVVNQKDIFTTYPSGLNDIAEFSDGTLMGVGYVRDTHNQDALAMLIDTNLMMLKQEHYGDENYDNFYALKVLHNSQVGVVGVHTNPTSQESNMWIVKLNQDATMAQIPLAAAGFYEQLKKLFADEIAAKQLSISQDLTIELIDSRLYFDIGSHTLTQTQKIFLEKFAAKLIPFLHKNQELLSSLSVNGHTSSEWGKSSFSNTYLNNEELSMQRSFSVLRYIFLEQNPNMQQWLTQKLKGAGLGYAKRLRNKGVEDKEKSRRVNFEIELKSKED